MRDYLTHSSVLSARKWGSEFKKRPRHCCEPSVTCRLERSTGVVWQGLHGLLKSLRVCEFEKCKSRALKVFFFFLEKSDRDGHLNMFGFKYFVLSEIQHYCNTAKLKNVHRLKSLFSIDLFKLL